MAGERKRFGDFEVKTGESVGDAHSYSREERMVFKSEQQQ